MVEAVVKQLAGSTGQTIVIDVGTGTGCIPISIFTSLKHANLKTIAIDISKQALCVAQKNAQLHNATITFLHGNLLEPIFNNETMKQYNNATVVITANLPYLTRKQFQDEPSIKREPYSALVAEENGLALYRELLEQITTKLLPVYKESLTLYFEIDPSQNSAIFELLQKYLPSAHNELRKDFGGHDRLVISTLPTRS
jgi:release factor glutamine methyltransferase